MKTAPFCLVLAISLIMYISFFSATTRAQGSLTPPGAPAPTMKTLDQIEPRTPISSLPYNITSPGSYYVTTTLTGGVSQFGITIATNNVTLDLNGFALVGAAGSLSGIYINGSYFNITIRNGSLSGWGSYGVDGFSAGFPKNVTCENLKVWGNTADGIATEAGSIIRNCQVFSNGTTGIFSAGALIVDTVASGNGSFGFYVSSSKVRSCISQNNLTGVYADHSTIEDCDISDNSTIGLDVASACQIVNNRISGHTNVNGDAIYVNGAQNSIIANMLLNNYNGLNASQAGCSTNCILQNRFIGSSSNVVNSFNMFPSVEVDVPIGENFGSTNSFINIIYP